MDASPASQLSPLKRALLALDKMQARLDALENEKREPIAVIGMGCRFPGGVTSPESFWRLLSEGRDAVGEYPANRPGADAWRHADVSSETRRLIRHGGFLDAVEEFDAAFFGISPREAVRMDPQQRLLLQVSVEALEAAGQPLEKLNGTATGVFVGMHNQSCDYYLLQAAGSIDLDTYTSTGCAHSICANRLSYILDLRGPSLTVDTACSSSLVALHLACQSLRNRECNLAIAGGSNLILLPESTLSLTKMDALSPDGRCKTFDASANGFVRAEGCGMIVLKHLANAVKDGDPILAVIRGTAINQDGATNGLTAPNPLSQESVIKAALKNAGLEPACISFIEAHGTGTPLGDPIEVEALRKVLGSKTRCAIGAVKSVIGHAEGAAGIAGVIKTVLALGHKVIPPNLHFHKLNPHISLDGSAFFFPFQTIPWEAPEGKRYAGVSSFGFGGTNAHVILEEAPESTRGGQETSSPTKAVMLPLSARSDGALKQLVSCWREMLGNAAAENSLRDLIFTASVRRSHHPKRLAVVGVSCADLHAKLAAIEQGGEQAGVAQGNAQSEPPRVAFVFSGQGPQWWAMGRELMALEPVYRSELERIAALARKPAGFSIIEELARSEGESRLQRTDVAQPALFAVQMGLAALWKSWGIEPEAVVGHSIGEVAAACVAGVLTLEDAVSVACHRGRLMHRDSGRGRMAAAEIAVADAEKLIAPYDGRLSLAAVNTPESVTLSGEEAALSEVLASLEKRGVIGRFLKVDYAFHSPVMEAVKPELREALRGLEPAAAALPIVSTVTGEFARAGDFGADYWPENIRRPVLFSQAMDRLIADGCTLFLEIAPHPVLSTSIAQRLEARGVRGSVVPSLHRGRPERETMLNALGALYVLGQRVNWRNVSMPGRVVPLPPYPWQQKHFWLELGEKRPARSAVTKPAEFSPDNNAVKPADMLFELVWQPAANPVHPLPQKFSSASGSVPSTENAWLVFEDHSPLCAQVVSSLAARGQPVARIRRGKTFAVITEGLYEVDAARRDHLERGVTAALTWLNAPCVHAVCLWGAPETYTVGARRLYEQTNLLYLEVVHAIQALISAPRPESLRLWLVTQGAQPAGATVPDCRVTPLWGLGRALAVEHPDNWGGLVDMEPEAQSRENADAIITQVLEPEGEKECAFRRGVRFVPRLVPQSEAAESPLEWSADGCYLVTGGLGGVGLHLAGWLASQGARKIVLVGRTPLPPRVEWETVEHGSRVFEQIAAVRQIERHGTAVKTLAVDIADEQNLRLALQTLQAENWLPVKGVIHAAGAMEERLVKDLDLDAINSLFRAKILGALNLEECLADQPLQFFVCCSSLASLLAKTGMANYSAANAFLDAFVLHRRAKHQPALGVNWGVWLDTGMARASTASLVISVLEQQGFRCLLPSQGTAALNLLMRRRSAQAVVVAVDWSKFRQTYPVGEEPALLANLAVHLGPLPAHHSEKPGTASKNNVREQLLALDSGPARRALLENHLKSLLAAVLKLQPSEIDEHKTMGAHGLDSLMGFEMRRRSEQSLGLKLSGTMVWNYPTIAALTEHLAGKLEISLADSAADGSPSASVKPAPIVPERANAVVSTVTTLSDDEALQALLGRGSS